MDSKREGNEQRTLMFDFCKFSDVPRGDDAALAKVACGEVLGWGVFGILRVVEVEADHRESLGDAPLGRGFASAGRLQRWTNPPDGQQLGSH
jgi:hypothetical protein